MPVHSFVVRLALAAMLAVSISAVSNTTFAEATLPASQFNKPIFESRPSIWVRTVNNDVKIRDMNGTQLFKLVGAAYANIYTHPNGPYSKCPNGGDCIRIQAFETVSSSAGTLYYVYPFDSNWGANAIQKSGFVRAAEIVSPPPNSAMNIGAANGNGQPAPAAPGAPRYAVTPAEIGSGLAYWVKKDNLVRPFEQYGNTHDGSVAMMSWNWTNATDGAGLGRALVPAGATFEPSDVEPITVPALPRDYLDQWASTPHDPDDPNDVPDLGRAIGSITVRYGKVVSAGNKTFYGWMVTKHSQPGGCYEHMRYIGGGPRVSATRCGQDLGIYDPVPGNWSVALNNDLGGWAMGVWKWGWADDGVANKFKPLAADFTGDGKTDVAIYDGRPGVGIWSIVPSTGGAFATPEGWAFNWGANAEAGRYQVGTGDFDGNVKDDAFIFDPRSGSWSVGLSTGSGFSLALWATGWGMDDPPPPAQPAGLRSLSGDFNGDGKTDVGIYDPSNGYWSIGLSNGSGFPNRSVWMPTSGTVGWGMGGVSNHYHPLTADFNGDGKTDIGIYDPGNGYWGVALSNGNGFAWPQTWLPGFGAGGWDSTNNEYKYRPVVGDFNGDDRADAMLYFRNAGEWKVAYSTGGAFGTPETVISPWGQLGDQAKYEPLNGYFN